MEFRDAQGRRAAGARVRLNEESVEGADSTRWIQEGVATFDLPEGFKIESLDVVRIVDSEELSIPFDFSGTALQ